QALAAVHAEPVDLIVLDVMMPGVDGLGVASVLRAEEDRTPILMLTARVETPDRVAGLDAGADDCLAKPFELDELLARLRALLRRATPVPDGEDPERPLTGGELRLDPRACRVSRGEREVAASKTALALLEVLMRSGGNAAPVRAALAGGRAESAEVEAGHLRRRSDRRGGRGDDRSDRFAGRHHRGHTHPYRRGERVRTHRPRVPRGRCGQRRRRPRPR